MNDDFRSYFITIFCHEQSGSGKMFHDKLITNEKIKKGKRIGNGQFGEVYKGTFFMFTRFCYTRLNYIFLKTCQY